MAMKLTASCNRKQLADFLTNQLEIEDKLDFLYHLDYCPQCWEEVYNATKAQHPHYYKSTSRRAKGSKRQLKQVNKDEIVEVA